LDRYLIFLVSRLHKRIPHLPTLGDMSWLIIRRCRQKLKMLRIEPQMIESVQVNDHYIYMDGNPGYQICRILVKFSQIQ
jgi:hypothetical protein